MRLRPSLTRKRPKRQKMLMEMRGYLLYFRQSLQKF